MKLRATTGSGRPATQAPAGESCAMLQRFPRVVAAAPVTREDGQVPNQGSAHLQTRLENLAMRRAKLRPSLVPAILKRLSDTPQRRVRTIIQHEYVDSPIQILCYPQNQAALRPRASATFSTATMPRPAPPPSASTNPPAASRPKTTRLPSAFCAACTPLSVLPAPSRATPPAPTAARCFLASRVNASFRRCERLQGVVLIASDGEAAAHGRHAVTENSAFQLLQRLAAAIRLGNQIAVGLLPRGAKSVPACRRRRLPARRSR